MGSYRYIHYQTALSTWIIEQFLVSNLPQSSTIQLRADDSTQELARIYRDLNLVCRLSGRFKPVAIPTNARLTIPIISIEELNLPAEEQISPTQPRMDLSQSTILLTGGTGSFGNAFARRIARDWPTATVRIYSRDELKQSEMRDRFAGDQFRFMIGDVRDRHRLMRAASGVDVLIHAAALKQVPACEYNPFEAVQTNVIGAQNVVDVAIDSGVRSVIGVSTDKAVNPVNLYGATKLCAEKIMIQGNAYAARSETRISCVRYGNVIGSRGSVVNVFRSQRDSGTVPITDPRMTRFWISLDQAVDLVLYAIREQIGGEVFVPKIPSIKITDLASAMAPGVPTKIVGIRAGEKLHELLITADESRHAFEHDDVFVIVPEHPWWEMTNKWQLGTPLKDGFVYSSESNDHWLDEEYLRQTVT